MIYSRGVSKKRAFSEDERLEVSNQLLLPITSPLSPHLQPCNPQNPNPNTNPLTLDLYEPPFSIDAALSLALAPIGGLWGKWRATSAPCYAPASA